MNTGNGGGLVQINASTITLDGAIQANGGVGGNFGGAGSGGGVLIITSQLAGVGRIEANGGSTSGSNPNGGGGGARIAVFYDDAASFDLANVGAAGGTGVFGGANGGAGTVFLKNPTQLHGDLIVDNGGMTAPADSTPLRAIGQETSTDLAANTLTTAGAAFPVPDPASGALGLIGLKLNPNAAQGQTFAIIDNTATTITTDPADGAMPLVAGPGDSYIGVYTFDNLSVVNGARVITDDECLIIGIINTLGGTLTCANIP